MATRFIPYVRPPQTKPMTSSNTTSRTQNGYSFLPRTSRQEPPISAAVQTYPTEQTKAEGHRALIANRVDKAVVEFKRDQVRLKESELRGNTSDTLDLVAECTENKALDHTGSFERECIEQDLQSTFENTNLSSGRTKPVEASGLWYDVEEGRFIDPPGLPLTKPPVSKSLPTNGNKDVSNIPREPAFSSTTPLPMDNNSWADISITTLEKELRLPPSEQAILSSDSIQSSICDSVDILVYKIHAQEHSETTVGVSDVLQVISSKAKVPEEHTADELGFHTGQSPPITNSQVDRTKKAASSDDERRSALRISQSPLEVTERCLSTEEEEDRQDNASVADNSEDKDYIDLTDDEATRPAKRQKSLLTDVYTHQHPSAPGADTQLHTPHSSRAPSAASPEFDAKYREWRFEGRLKSARIGDKTTFNLEFILDLSESSKLSAPFKALAQGLSPKLSDKTRVFQTMRLLHNQHRKSPSTRKRNPWTVEEDALLKKIRDEQGRSWEEISSALPLHPRGSIEVRYSQKYSSASRSRKRQRW